MLIAMGEKNEGLNLLKQYISSEEQKDGTQIIVTYIYLYSRYEECKGRKIQTRYKGDIPRGLIRQGQILPKYGNQTHFIDHYIQGVKSEHADKVESIKINSNSKYFCSTSRDCINIWSFLPTIKKLITIPLVS